MDNRVKVTPNTSEDFKTNLPKKPLRGNYSDTDFFTRLRNLCFSHIF